MHLKYSIVTCSIVFGENNTKGPDLCSPLAATECRKIGQFPASDSKLPTNVSARTTSMASLVHSPLPLSFG